MSVKKIIKTPYTKPFKTINEQIDFLKNRNLIIDNIDKAFRYLNNISYYHLAVYMKPFQLPDNNFKTGTKFSDILNLYTFDKKLRFLLLDLLERVEISLKNTLIYDLTEKNKDIIWYSDLQNYNSNTKNNEIFSSFMNEIKNNKENYIRHFFNYYNTPEFPPSWMFFETLSFGSCCKILSIMNEANRTKVAKKYLMPHAKNTQWLRALSLLRNICAHHSRLWNRRFTYAISGNKTKYQQQLSQTQKNSLFAYLIVLESYLKKFNPTSSWKDRLELLIFEHKIDVSKMDFPSNWKTVLEEL